MFHEQCMEIVTRGQEYVICQADVRTTLGLSRLDFEHHVSCYRRRHKGLEVSTIGGKLYVSCKSLCQFLDYYQDQSYKVLPEVSDFRHALKPYTKKIPKRKLSRSMRVELAYRQEYKCNVCKVVLPPNFEVDHIQRLDEGGQDVLENLQCLCPPCHSEKTRLERLRRTELFGAEARRQHQRYVPSAVTEEVSTTSEQTESPKHIVTDEGVFSAYFYRGKKLHDDV